MKHLKVGPRDTSKIVIFSETMSVDGASFKARQKLAEDLSNDIFTLHVYPSSDGFFKSVRVSRNLHVIETPGILARKYRRGGFSFIDALFKALIVIVNRPKKVHVTNGHRPAHLFSVILSKCLTRKISFIDERWEAFNCSDWIKLRKGALGRLILIYDYFFEKNTTILYDYTICVTKYLSQYLSCKNPIIACPEIYTNNLKFLSKSKCKYKTILISAVEKIDQGDYKDIIPVLKHSIEEDTRLVITGNSEWIEKFFRAEFGDKLINLGWLNYQSYLDVLHQACLVILPLENTVRNNARWPIKINAYCELGKTVLFSNHEELSTKRMPGFIKFSSDSELSVLVNKHLANGDLIGAKQNCKKFCSTENKIRRDLLLS